METRTNYYPSCSFLQKPKFKRAIFQYNDCKELEHALKSNYRKEMKKRKERKEKPGLAHSGRRGYLCL